MKPSVDYFFARNFFLFPSGWKFSLKILFNLIGLADVIILVLNHTAGGPGVYEKAFPNTSYSIRFLRSAQDG